MISSEGLGVEVADSDCAPPPFGRRRAPQQLRSRTTVECIKQAAQEIVSTDGFADATTGRIAERAGVSIGSLYQYFTTREAILLVLYEDVSIEAAAEMRQLTVEIIAMPLQPAVRASVTRLLEWHERHRLILLDLPAAMPEMKLGSHPVSYDNLVRSAVRAFVSNQTNCGTGDDLDRIVFFLEQIVIGSIRAFVSGPPRHLTASAFVSELTGIIVPFLERQGDL